MSFFTASKKAEDVKASGGAYISGSGMFPVTIIAAIASASKGGSTSVDLYVDHSGQKQIVYGNLRISNNDGTPNAIGAKVFNQLMLIAGFDSLEDPVSGELPIGPKGVMKPVDILEELCDAEAIMRVQMEYGAYNGDITEKKVIKAFFRPGDNASAEEIVNDSEAGKGYEREMKYVDNITFKDGVTQEQVTAWITAQRPKGTAGAGGASSTAKKAPAFSKKRFGTPAEAPEAAEPEH
jgi:hypothetical protein